MTKIDIGILPVVLIVGITIGVLFAYVIQADRAMESNKNIAKDIKNGCFKYNPNTKVFKLVEAK